MPGPNRPTPGFDLRRPCSPISATTSISYERAPRGNTPAELESPPSIFLLGSPNPEQLAVALKRLFVIFPQGDAPAEREFLGRKIFSVPVASPALPHVRSFPAGPTAHFELRGQWRLRRHVHRYPAARRILAQQRKPGEALREKPGLLEAAQKVGGMGTGYFGYENQADTMRAAFEAAKNDPGPPPTALVPASSRACPA